MEQQEIDAAFSVLRAHADASGYGSMISDASLRDLAQAIIEAVDKVRAES